MQTENRLVVFYYGSFLPPANGSHVRITSMLDRLAQEFSNITLYSYDNHPECPWTPAAEAAFRQRWPGVEVNPLLCLHCRLPPPYERRFRRRQITAPPGLPA